MRKLLNGLFGVKGAFTYRRSTYYRVNEDNAAAMAFEQFTPNRTPPFVPEIGQGRVWGGSHVRMDLYLTSAGLLTLQRLTPPFDFEEISTGETASYDPSVEAAQLE